MRPQLRKCTIDDVARLFDGISVLDDVYLILFVTERDLLHFVRLFLDVHLILFVSRPALRGGVVHRPSRPEHALRGDAHRIILSLCRDVVLASELRIGRIFAEKAPCFISAAARFVDDAGTRRGAIKDFVQLMIGEFSLLIASESPRLFDAPTAVWCRV